MDYDNLDWDTLLRYINGESTPEEQEIIQEWMNIDPDNEKFISFLQEVWNTSAEKKESWDVDSAWSQFSQKHNFPSKEEENISDESHNIHQIHQVSKVSSKARNYSWVAVAAVVMFCLLSALAYQFFPATQSTPIAESKAPVYKEIVTKNGQRTHLNLSDGSRVILNAGSKISIPESFNKNETRDILLSGEAYFEVAHNPERPFVVHTERSVTKVLGTKFQVSSYPDDQDVRVVVSEGKVAFSGLENEESSSNAILIKNQIGYLTDHGEAKVTNAADLSRYLGWTEGKLVFHREPLRKVVIRLKRWYDVDVQLDPLHPALAQRELTATFAQNQPIQQVIETIALTLDLQTEQEEGRFTLNYFNNNDQ